MSSQLPHDLGMFACETLQVTYHVVVAKAQPLVRIEDTDALMWQGSCNPIQVPLREIRRLKQVIKCMLEAHSALLFLLLQHRRLARIQ